MNIKDLYKFIIFGDSISKGVIYDEEKNRYVTLRENYAWLLQDKFNGILFNAGKFGNTIIRGMSRFDKDVMNNKPDIVLIEFGGNDCDFNWDDVAKSPSEYHSPNTDFESFKKYLYNLIEILKNNSINPVLLSLPPIDPDKYFKWISKDDTKRGENILKWLGTVNKIYWWQEKYNCAIIDAAQETKVPLIDIRGAFLESPDYTKLLCKDGIHPNVDGHKTMANKIFNYAIKNYPFLVKRDILLNT